MPAGELSGARGYSGYPLPGSPAGNLRDAAAGILAAGALARCPHPEQPAFWYIPVATLACAQCAGAFLEVADGAEAVCHICGQPASAVAAWVAADIACMVRLCEDCSAAGVIPLVPN